MREGGGRSRVVLLYRTNPALSCPCSIARRCVISMLADAHGFGGYMGVLSYNGNRDRRRVGKDKFDVFKLPSAEPVLC